MTNYLMTAVILTLVTFAPDAQARSFRVDQVPNGSAYGCALCHNDANGGGPRTGFGNQVFDSLDAGNLQSSAVDWSAIYDLDGDSDGYSNGLELGDPDGTWTIGDPDPANSTNPADRTDNLCGDGILNGDEECDSDPMGATCADMELGPGGEPTCSDRCTLDFSTCDGAEMGNASTNNATQNNAAGNNASGNNSTTGNSQTGNTNDQIDDGFVGDDSDDDEPACATAAETPGLVALVLFALVALRRRSRTA